jgi:threonine/homoserine/homoserine lactone efflux protein
VLPIWAFIGVALPLVLTPGASTAVVLRNSISGGTRAGLETAVGANAGSVCLGMLCALGFSIALQQWPAAWLLIRVAGVAYLAWLGVQSLGRGLRPRARIESIPSTEPPLRASSTARNFREGFITNTTNPALATFYFVILPQFIPRGASVARAALVLTCIHVSLALTWHAVWAGAGSALSRTLASRNARRALDLIVGVVLLALAVRLVV